MKAAAIVVVILGAIALAVGLFALLALLVWALWNALVPDLFSGPEVSYLQAVLITLVLGVLGSIFGGSSVRATSS